MIEQVNELEFVALFEREPAEIIGMRDVPENGIIIHELIFDVREASCLFH